MRSILIFVLVVALAVMVLGLANLDGRADIDYLFGTWQDVSLLELFAIGAGLVIVVGVVAAVFASLHAKRDRHKLELELQQIYVRLRVAEAALPPAPDAPLPDGPDAPLPDGPDAPLPDGPDAPLPEGPDAPLPEGPEAALEATAAADDPAPDHALAVDPGQELADEAPETAVADGDPVDPAVG